MASSRIKMIYMSGTGNTAWVARRVATWLRHLGNAVISLSVEETTPADFGGCDADVMGVMFPVWSSWAPAPLREFLDALPPAEGMPLFAIACPAIFGGDAAWYACRPLARKGYRPFLYANVFMPNVLYPVPTPDGIGKTLARAERKIESVVGDIHARRRRIEGVHPLGWLGGCLQRAGGPPLERRFQSAIFADEGCTRCGWCAEHCPVDNVEMTDAGPHFLGACVYCARCFHYCPAHAIQLTDATRNEDRFRRYAGVDGRYGGAGT